MKRAVLLVCLLAVVGCWDASFPAAKTPPAQATMGPGQVKRREALKQLTPPLTKEEWAIVDRLEGANDRDDVGLIDNDGIAFGVTGRGGELYRQIIQNLAARVDVTGLDRQHWLSVATELEIFLELPTEKAIEEVSRYGAETTKRRIDFLMSMNSKPAESVSKIILESSAFDKAYRKRLEIIEGKKADEARAEMDASINVAEKSFKEAQSLASSPLGTGETQSMRDSQVSYAKRYAQLLYDRGESFKKLQKALTDQR